MLLKGHTIPQCISVYLSPVYWVILLYCFGTTRFSVCKIFNRTGRTLIELPEKASRQQENRISTTRHSVHCTISCWTCFVHPVEMLLAAPFCFCLWWDKMYEILTSWFSVLTALWLHRSLAKQHESCRWLTTECHVNIWEYQLVCNQNVSLET